jgi:hypothetical protein
VLLTSFILSNPADASNISFTGSPDVLNGNSGGTFTQLFNGDGGAIASNPVVVDGRPVSSADLLLNELSTSGKVSTITFPDQDGELVAQNFGSGLGQGFLNLGNGQNKSGALDKPYIHNGGAGKTPINPSSPNASGVFGVPNHGTGAKPTSDLGRGFINVGRNPISNPSSAGNTTPRTPAADSTRGINTLYNFAGTGALTNFNPSGVNFTSSATANNLLNNLTQQGQKFFNDPLVQTAILNAAIGDTGKPINNQLTGNPQNNSSVVPVLGSTAILAGSGSGTSWLPSLAPLVQALGQYVPPVAAFGAAFFGNTQPAGEGSEIIPVGRMFDPSEFNQVGLNPNAFNQLGMGAIAPPIPGANPSTPLDQGMGNLTFNTPLAPDLVTGVSVPTSPASPTNINPTFGAPVENLPTSPLANPSFAPPIVTQPSLQPESPVFVAPGLVLPTSPTANPAFAGPVEFLPTSPIGSNSNVIDPNVVGREIQPFFTGSFSDPNSINYGKDSPALPPEVEIFPNSSSPRFDPNNINQGQNPPVLPNGPLTHPESQPLFPPFLTIKEENLFGTHLPRAGENNKHGTWTGERGDSVFIPNLDSPHFSNVKASGILAGGEGIPYRDGRIDLTNWTIPGHEIEVPEIITNMGNNRADQKAANRAFAELQAKLQADGLPTVDGARTWTKSNGEPNGAEAKRYMEANGLIWHHADGITMQAVPVSIHYDFRHSGPASDMRNNSKNSGN